MPLERTSDTPPVILIGLDAAEIDVVDRLVADGRMPNLARLRQQGHWGRLQTEPPADVENMRRVTQLFGHAVSDAGIGHLERAFPDTPAGWREALEPAKHHMGTTRMHVASPLGVVDENSRVHGTSNLYVTGSSIFPSGGYANPTLTIVALAARLADHLKRVAGR